jgi:hypothetical protein
MHRYFTERYSTTAVQKDKSNKAKQESISHKYKESYLHKTDKATRLNQIPKEAN